MNFVKSILAHIAVRTLCLLAGYGILAGLAFFAATSQRIIILAAAALILFGSFSDKILKPAEVATNATPAPQAPATKTGG